MKVLESKEDQYQNILDASIERVIHGGESLKTVLLDHPAWAERLQMDIQLVCELTSMQQSLDPRPGVLDQTRHELLQEIKTTPPQTTSPPAEWWSSILSSRMRFFHSAVITRNGFCDEAISNRRSNLFKLKPLSSLAEWWSSILPSRMALSHSTTLRPSARNDRLSTLLYFLKSPKLPNRYLQTAQKCLFIAVILLFTIFSLQALNLGTSGSLPGSELFPIRVASYIGLTVGGLSVIFGIYLIVKRMINADIPAGWTSTLVVIAFLFGINFFFLGIIGEYLGRTYLETKGRPKYIISRIIEGSK